MDFKGFPGLAGKTAIVTGSTQGLGADIARGLACGWRQRGAGRPQCPGRPGAGR